MKAIGQILGQQNLFREPTKIIDHKPFQISALYIIEKLNIPVKRKSAYFAACKKHPELVGGAFTFAVDHPIIEARDKMFFWKLNDLVRSKKTD